MDAAQHIVKRGYLFDKKIGILPVTVDRKRWYVLRQDTSQGHRILLEYFKDEKAASKGDSPKGVINIRDVVSVQRVSDKKQTFEILCPGVGYRLMANSEAEADEWTETIKKFILYKRDDGNITNGMKSMSLGRVQGSPGLTHLAPPLRDMHRTMSDSTYHHHIHGPPHMLPPSPSYLQPRSIPIVSAHPSRHRSTTETHSMVHLTHSLPTPPESYSSPPAPSFSSQPPPSFQRQRSTEVAPSLPSPSTSSDSSLCSGSNISFEGTGSVFEADAPETKSVFRVQVKETENLNIVGAADLIVTEEGLRLKSLSPDQQEIFWSLGSLRRYGVSNLCFTIIAGRFCATGEGRFQFYTDESRAIHTRVHGFATQKAASTGKGRSLPRRSSESGDLCGRSPQQTTPIHGINLNHSLPSHLLSTSPPTFYIPSSEEPGRYLPPGSIPSHHSVGGGMYTHSVTQPIAVGAQIMPNQQYLTQYSPTRNMCHQQQQYMTHPQQQLSPAIVTNNIYNSRDPREKSHSNMNTPYSQSGDGQSQSEDNMKSESSGSSLGADSGYPETPYPISDQEEEPTSINS